MNYFADIYAKARATNDPSKLSWEDQVPNASFVGWADKSLNSISPKSALVPGCGLGYEAEYLDAKGVEVTAFDAVPTAVDWAREIHQNSKVNYQVADLFALPENFGRAFDFEALVPPMKL